MGLLVSKYITNDKILYHPERVTKWLKRQFVSPITVQIQPSNICNQNCFYCIAKGQKGSVLLDTNTALNIINRLTFVGVNGIIFTGGGEPTLHEDLDKIIEYTKKYNIDIGLETNGSTLNDRLLGIIIKNATWIRISLDSVEKKAYYKDRGSND